MFTVVNFNQPILHFEGVTSCGGRGGGGGGRSGQTLGDMTVQKPFSATAVYLKKCRLDCAKRYTCTDAVNCAIFKMIKNCYSDNLNRLLLILPIDIM